MEFAYGPRNLETLSEDGGISNSLRKRPLRNLLLPGYFLFHLVSLIRAIRTIRPAVIHAHWLIPQGFVVALCSVLYKKTPPYVVTSHGGDLYGFNGGAGKAIKRFVLKRAHSICVVSDSMRHYISEQYGSMPREVLIAPMGVDLLTTFTPDPAVSRKPKSIIFAGRLVEKKGVEFLIAAVAELKSTYPAITLSIVGAGPELQKLQEAVSRLDLESSITFTGALSHHELVPLYRCHEIAVFPFVQASDGDMEGLGLVTIEAIGCGTPVIVGNVPAVRDIVTNNQTGLLCNDVNSAELANLISYLFDHDEVRASISQEGLKKVNRSFGWTTCAKRYSSVLELAGNAIDKQE